VITRNSECSPDFGEARGTTNHFGWEETHRDLSKAGRLYLKGHPIDEDVYTVDRHDHPVVVNADGFYVYESLQPRNNTDDKGEKAKTYQS
jgi:hypothetical protein